MIGDPTHPIIITGNTHMGPLLKWLIVVKVSESHVGAKMLKCESLQHDI